MLACWFPAVTTIFKLHKWVDKKPFGYWTMMPAKLTFVWMFLL